MKQNDAMPCFLFLILGTMIGGVFGGCHGVSSMRNEAVRKNHAEWVSDASGKPEFKWKECK